MGINLYSEIGIQLPDLIYAYSAWIAIALGVVIQVIGKESTAEEDNTAEVDNTAEADNTAEEEIYGQGEFSEKGIQEVLDKYFFLESEAEFFVYNISESANLFVQGYRNEVNNCGLEIIGKSNLCNPEILDSHKYKKLILLGWKAPVEGWHFTFEVTVKDCLDGKVASLLIELLKIFDLS